MFCPGSHEPGLSLSLRTINHQSIDAIIPGYKPGGIQTESSGLEILQAVMAMVGADQGLTVLRGSEAMVSHATEFFIAVQNGIARELLKRP